MDSIGNHCFEVFLVGKKRCAQRCYLGGSPVFLAASEHNWPLPHQATKKGTFRGNLGNLRKLRKLNLRSLKKQTHVDLFSLYWEASASASWIFRTLWGILVNKRAKNFRHSFFGVMCITAIEFRNLFLKSRFKGLSSSIYFSVTKLPETCSVAVFIFWRRLQVGKSVHGRTYFFTFSWSQCVEIRLTAVLCTSIFSATSSLSINRLYWGKRGLQDTTKY